mmetsp:Transcript_18002/g.50315  ORF Transcript_18002/g.50315 Transcript_18002/m.50315 type:complete len:546 (+) Transcript_18002:755-2392(+)
MPPPPFTNKHGAPYSPQTDNTGEGPVGPPIQHPELQPTKLRRLAGLLSELAEFSRGLEQRHGADHSVAIKLRVLHRDLSKWAQPVLYPLGLVPLSEIAATNPHILRHPHQNSNTTTTTGQAGLGHLQQPYLPSSARSSAEQGVMLSRQGSMQQPHNSTRSSQGSPVSSMSFLMGTEGSNKHLSEINGSGDGQPNRDSAGFSFSTPSRPTSPLAPSYRQQQPPSSSPGSTLIPQGIGHHQQLSPSARMGEGGGHHQRLSPSPSPSAHMGRGGGMMGGLGLGSELSRQTSMGSAGFMSPRASGLSPEKPATSTVGPDMGGSSLDRMGSGMNGSPGMSPRMGGSSLDRMGSGMGAMPAMSGMSAGINGGVGGGSQLQDMAALMAQQAAAMKAMAASSGPGSPHTMLPPPLSSPPVSPAYYNGGTSALQQQQLPMPGLPSYSMPPLHASPMQPSPSHGPGAMELPRAGDARSAAEPAGQQQGGTQAEAGSSPSRGSPGRSPGKGGMMSALKGSASNSSKGNTQRTSGERQQSEKKAKGGASAVASLFFG